MRILIIFGLLLVMGVTVAAQEVQVTSFSKQERDLLARTQERLDLNDEPCAVVRVSIANADTYTFEGNIVGDVIYQRGEAIVYMAAGARNLTLKSQRSGTTFYEFPMEIEKQVVYKLELKLYMPEDKKTRTLVMPEATYGQGNVLAGGIRIGLIKKTGGYIGVKYNFTGQDTDYECNEQGELINDYFSGYSIFTGESKVTRMAFTAGIIQRLAKPVYIYLGGGYGWKNVAWEMIESVDNYSTKYSWAKCTDKSFIGYEVEIGMIFRLKNICLSIGGQTNQFKYFEGSAGFGIMF